MRKTLLIIMALIAVVVCANAADRKVTKIIIAAASEGDSDDAEYYIYNPQGQLIWMQTSSTRYEYEYDADGNLMKRNTLSWIAADRAYKVLNTAVYEYGADGNVSKMNRSLNLGSPYQRNYYYTYSDYKNGEATAWKEYNADSGNLRYEYKVENALNTDGTIAKKTVYEFDPDYPEDGYYIYETNEYTYLSNGDIDTEVYTTYKQDGTVKKTSKRTYTYSDLDASYVPANLKADVNGASIVLSWDAVAGAESYVVTYDQEHTTVSATTFTAKDIAVGDHLFAVQAVVDGTERNAATPVSATVADPGKLPAEKLAAGKSKKVVETNDEGDDVTFYVVPLTWAFPAGHSAIKDIRVYYNDNYVSLNSQKATSYDLKLYEWQARNTNSAGDFIEGGVTFNIAVTIMYGSGESEKSNIVVANPYNEVNGIDAILAPQIATDKASSIYNLAGQRVDVSHKGIIIVDGKKILKK